MNRRAHLNFHMAASQRRTGNHNTWEKMRPGPLGGRNQAACQ